MGISSTDYTYDTANTWDATESLAANATSNSLVLDIGPQIPRLNAEETDGNYRTRVVGLLQGIQKAELLQLRAIVTTCETATATSIAYINIQGSNTDDFSGNVYNIATLVLGHTTAIAGAVGVTGTSSRGVGEYVLPFYAQAQCETGINAAGAAISGAVPSLACRYLRIQSKTVGASSSLAFSARIEKI